MSNATEQKTLLTDLRPAKGATKNKLRVGRGRASGAGKTCNRGHNGEGQRSGLSRKRGFEGGQIPLFRRMPKIGGFEQINRLNWLELNVGQLAEFVLPAEDTLTLEKLVLLGILNPNKHDGVRILGNGEISRKLSVEAHYITPGAVAKIQAAGGECFIVVDGCEDDSCGCD